MSAALIANFSSSQVSILVGEGRSANKKSDVAVTISAGGFVITIVLGGVLSALHRKTIRLIEHISRQIIPGSPKTGNQRDNSNMMHFTVVTADESVDQVYKNTRSKIKSRLPVFKWNANDPVRQLGFDDSIV